MASNKRDFLNNILHEIGHALQLNHDVDLSRGTSSAEVRKNLMHFGNSGNVSQSNRPNLYQWSGRAIEGDTIMRNISMTKQWNALNTHTLACNPPKDYDILIEDHPQDVGREPYWGPDDMWTSQSIWVRNEDDTIRIHENPVYNPSSDTAFVYVKAKNIGCLEVPSGEVQLYWSKASTGLEWPINWKDTTITPRVQGRIHPLYDYHARLLDIDPGEYKIIRYLWKVPDPEDYDDKLHHVCLLAKTSSDDIPINYAIDSTKLWDIVPRNSEIAWKNLSIVPPPDTGYYTKPTTVWLRPILPKILNTQVTIRVSSSKSDITLGGDVILHLKGNLYDKWINRTGKDAPTILGGQKIKINANNTDLIFNNVAQYDIYSIDVIYYANPLMAQSVQFNVDLKQIENTILVGGERFEIRSSSLYTPPTPLLSNKEEEKPNIRFEISPNPVASDTDLYADIDLMNYKATFLQVKIIKIDGNVLSTSKVVQGRNTLHTNGLQSGTYVAILFDGTKVLSSKRFVVL